MSKLIYVHGVGNKAAPDVLKREWDHDLFARDLGEDSHMAYWADLRYDKPLSRESSRLEEEMPPLMMTSMEGSARPGLTEEAQSLAPPDPEAQAFAREFAVAQQDYALRVQQEMAGRLAEHSGRKVAAKPAPRPKVLGPSGRKLPAKPAPRPKVLGPIGDLLLRTFLERYIKDAAAYFFTDEGEKIRDRLRAALDAEKGPVLLIGHSLGSIISYDVLREDAFSSKAIPMYVTIGSQLGVREIQTRLRQPLSVPKPVSAWHNFFDRWDTSVMAQTLSDEFKPSGRIVDTTVDNTSSNNHSSSGYLTAPAVRRTVHQVFDALT